MKHLTLLILLLALAACDAIKAKEYKYTCSGGFDTGWGNSVQLAGGTVRYWHSGYSGVYRLKPGETCTRHSRSPYR
jgi:hypothetical protein